MQKHSAAAQEAAAAEAVKHSSDQEALAGSAPQQKEAAERSQTAGQAVSPEILPTGADAGNLAEIKQEALPPLGLVKASQAESSKLVQPAVPDTATMPGPVETGTALHASAGLWQNAQASLNLLTWLYHVIPLQHWHDRCYSEDGSASDRCIALSCCSCTPVHYLDQAVDLLFRPCFLSSNSRQLDWVVGDMLQACTTSCHPATMHAAAGRLFKHMF